MCFSSLSGLCRGGKWGSFEMSFYLCWPREGHNSQCWSVKNADTSFDFLASASGRLEEAKSSTRRDSLTSPLPSKETKITNISLNKEKGGLQNTGDIFSWETKHFIFPLKVGLSRWKGIWREFCTRRSGTNNSHYYGVNIDIRMPSESQLLPHPPSKWCVGPGPGGRWVARNKRAPDVWAVFWMQNSVLWVPAPVQ